MNRYRLFAATLVIVMLLSVLAPLGTVAAQEDGDDGLSVAVDENVVTVTANGTPVANATVDVTTTDGNDSYTGTGEYSTDDDGTAELPEPEEDVAIAVGATTEDDTAETTATLEAPAEGLSIGVTRTAGAYVATVTADGDGVGNATVSVSTVDENASYADAGTHTADENGTVALTAPSGNESVEISLETTVDGETASATAVLEPVDEDESEPKSFGALVAAFVENAKNESDGPLGITVANFVIEHNPGNAPAHAGPPDHAGPPGEDDESKGNQGPPEHAGGPSDSADNGNGNGNGDGNGGGPPAHANSSN